MAQDGPLEQVTGCDRSVGTWDMNGDGDSHWAARPSAHTGREWHHTRPASVPATSPSCPASSLLQRVEHAMQRRAFRPEAPPMHKMACAPPAKGQTPIPQTNKTNRTKQTNKQTIKKKQRRASGFETSAMRRTKHRRLRRLRAVDRRLRRSRRGHRAVVSSWFCQTNRYQWMKGE